MYKSAYASDTNTTPFNEGDKLPLEDKSKGKSFQNTILTAYEVFKEQLPLMIMCTKLQLEDLSIKC